MATRIQLVGDDKPLPTVPLTTGKINLGFYCDTCHDFIPVLEEEPDQEAAEIVAAGSLLIECSYCGARAHRGVSEFYRRTASEAWKYRGALSSVKSKKPKAEARSRSR